MKNFYVFVLSCCLFALPALSQHHHYVGSWEVNSDTSLSALQVLGVQYNALMEARVKCTRSGHEICILKHMDLVNFNTLKYSNAHGKSRSFTSYNALVSAIDHKFLQRGKIYEKTGSFTNSAPVTQLETLSARYMAISNALMACFQDGNDFCEFEDDGLNKRNSPYSNDAGQRRWRSDAFALVRGYKQLAVVSGNQ